MLEVKEADAEGRRDQCCGELYIQYMDINSLTVMEPHNGAIYLLD
jgi:hypothetical protein